MPLRYCNEQVRGSTLSLFSLPSPLGASNTLRKTSEFFYGMDRCIQFNLLALGQPYKGFISRTATAQSLPVVYIVEAQSDLQIWVPPPEPHQAVHNAAQAGGVTNVEQQAASHTRIHGSGRTGA